MIEELSIDEQMVPFKGISSLKLYIPKKPYKWGFKLFVLADCQGYIYDFFPYVGKTEPVLSELVPDLGSSSDAVLHLAESIPSYKNHNSIFPQCICRQLVHLNFSFQTSCN